MKQSYDALRAVLDSGYFKIKTLLVVLMNNFLIVFSL